MIHQPDIAKGTVAGIVLVVVFAQQREFVHRVAQRVVPQNPVGRPAGVDFVLDVFRPLLPVSYADDAVALFGFVVVVPVFVCLSVVLGTNVPFRCQPTILLLMGRCKSSFEWWVTAQWEMYGQASVIGFGVEFRSPAGRKTVGEDKIYPLPSANVVRVSGSIQKWCCWFRAVQRTGLKEPPDVSPPPPANVRRIVFGKIKDRKEQWNLVQAFVRLGTSQKVP